VDEKKEIPCAWQRRKEIGKEIAETGGALIARLEGCGTLPVLDPVRGVWPEATGHRTQLDRSDSLIVLRENAHVSPFLVAVPLRFDRQSCNRLASILLST
jgi:hypothetical protein